MTSAPVALVVEFASKLTPGRALDLACGRGRNALWLAEQGWDVTAVDSSPFAIEGLEHSQIRTVLADLEKHEFPLQPAAWDLIVVSRYLQLDLFAQLGPALCPGGLAIVITLMGEGRFRLQPGELKACFAGWEILHYRESDVAEFVGRPLALS